MAGLLGDVLPWVYSKSNALQRKVNGLLNDPMGEIEQTAGLLQDSLNQQNKLMDLAFSNPKRPFTVTNQNALSALIDRTMQGPMGFAPAGITAWHGSPHVFNKFDSGKIGTGEGAQAYGHGLYLAEAPEVAKQYAGMSKPQPKVSDESYVHAAKDFIANGMDPHAGLKAAYRGISGADVEAAVLSAKGGYRPNLYKVDLPDNAVAKMLDWDKPLSQQAPEVRRAVQATDWYKAAAARAAGPQGRLFGHPDEQTGAHIYKVMSEADQQSAATLKQQGIPGIRYLDGGSRGAGQGSSNFVVFPGEENLLRILERNGQPVK